MRISKILAVGFLAACCSFSSGATKTKSSNDHSTAKKTAVSRDKDDSDKESSRKDSSKKDDSEKQKSRNEDFDAGNRASLLSQNFDQARMDRLVFAFTNQQRRNYGLREFHWSDSLAQAATYHSTDMARRDYFSHKSGGFFSRTDVKDRIQAAGNSDRMMAENIAMLPVWKSETAHLGRDARGNYGTWFEQNGETYESLARDAVRMWMESPGHRKNLLNGAYSELGIGVARGMHQGVPYIYLTQDFGG